MQKSLSLLSLAVLVAACSPATPANPDITIDSPLPEAVVESPLLVTGRARGTWFFEASFPVRLLDAQGNEIAITHGDAQGEWMTEDFVPFTATLEFQTDAAAGSLVLQKDNPSGLPENDASVSMPVRFH